MIVKRTNFFVFTVFLLGIPSIALSTQYRFIVFEKQFEVQDNLPAMNNSGHVIGWSLTSNGKKLAFIYKDGNKKHLVLPGGDASYAHGINDKGHVVGWSNSKDRIIHAFLYRGGDDIDVLGNLNGKSSKAYSINNNAQIVGWVKDSDGNKEAFIYQKEGMAKLSNLVEKNGKFRQLVLSEAIDIKDNGYIFVNGKIDGEKKGFLLIPLSGTEAESVVSTDLEEVKDVLPAQRRELKLQSFEPNTVGVTFDDNDTGFLDFKISLKYPLGHSGKYEGKFYSWKYLPNMYFAFTGRFGQYIGSRDSAPVVGKRFNPLLYGRYWIGSDEAYIDLGYGHESNGQSIDSKEEYYGLRASLEEDGKDPDIADDNLSRGWDYVYFSWRKSKKRNYGRLSTYLKLKYFLPYGELQRGASEYYDWETNNEKKQRKEVDGISLIAKYTAEPDLLLRKTNDWLYAAKIAAIYTTGYDNLFKNNTYRLELTLGINPLPPIIMWYSDGYMSDLADYYERVSSFGFGFELRNFIEDL